MIALNSLILDKDYTELTDPLESMKPISEYGFEDVLYGGTVSHIAKLKDKNIFLLLDLSVDGIIVRDIAINDFNDFDFKDLKNYATSKNIEFKAIGTPKEDLIEKIKKVALVLN